MLYKNYITQVEATLTKALLAAQKIIPIMASVRMFTSYTMHLSSHIKMIFKKDNLSIINCLFWVEMHIECNNKHVQV